LDYPTPHCVKIEIEAKVYAPIFRSSPLGQPNHWGECLLPPDSFPS